MANKTICYPHSGKNSDPHIYVLSDIFFLTAKFFIAKTENFKKSTLIIWMSLYVFSLFIAYI